MYKLYSILEIAVLFSCIIILILYAVTRNIRKKILCLYVAIIIATYILFGFAYFAITSFIFTYIYLHQKNKHHINRQLLLSKFRK